MGRPLCPRDPDGAPRRARARLSAGPARQGLRCAPRRTARSLRRTPDTALSGASVVGGVGRREDLAQARRSLPHRSAQDQQCSRPGPARLRDGQTAGDRRDRRRPARSGDGDGGGVARSRVPRLHGRRGHATTGPERLSDAAHGRRGDFGGRWGADPQGRHQRSAAGLGHQCPLDPLHSRIGPRSAPLPDDGARFSDGHRSRDHGPVSAFRPWSARCHHRLHRRWIERRRDLFRLYSTHPRSARRRRGRRPRPGRRQPRGAIRRRWRTGCAARHPDPGHSG